MVVSKRFKEQINDPLPPNLPVCHSPFRGDCDGDGAGDRIDIGVCDMTYDPSEPRDRSGKWSGGAARGHNAGGGNRAVALAIARGAVQGIAEGVVLSTVIGAATGGLGEIATPGLIVRGAIKGAIAGAKLHPVHVALGAGIGAASGLSAHRERMKAAVKQQHKKG